MKPRYVILTALGLLALAGFVIGWWWTFKGAMWLYNYNRMMLKFVIGLGMLRAASGIVSGVLKWWKKKIDDEINDMIKKARGW